MRVSGNNRQQQLEIANAIKIARELALLPYAKRVSSSGRTRPPRDGDRERRGPREDRDATPQVAAVVAEGAEDEVGSDEVMSEESVG